MTVDAVLGLLLGVAIGVVAACGVFVVVTWGDC